jgi:hypothetical protein
VVAPVKLLLLALILIASPVRPVAAQESLPPDLQLTLLAKVLSFDRRVDQGEEIVVVIIGQQTLPTSARARAAWRAAAQKSPTLVVGESVVRVVTVEYGPGLLAGLQALDASVAVIAPLRGVDVAALGQELRAAGIRTATGVAEYEPHVAISLLVRQGRPHIVIRQAHARREGSDYSAQLLRLAEVHL